LQESLGIALHNNSLYLTHLKKSWGGVKCVGFRMIALSASSGHAQESAVADRIEEFLISQKIKTREVYVTASKDDVLYKRITLPRAVLDNLQKVLEYEFDNFFPFTQDQVLFDYTVLESKPDDETQVELLITAIHRDRYERCQDLMQMAGLTPLCVEPPISARISLFQWLQSQELLPTPLLVLDAQTKGMEVDLYVDERWEWKNIMAGPSLEQELKQQLFQMEGQVRQMDKKEWAGAELPLMCLNEKVITGEFLREMEEYFPLLDSGSVFTTLGLKIGSIGLLYSFGAALQGFERHGLRFNYIPRAERKKLKRGSLYFFVSLMAVLALIGICWILTPYVQAKIEHKELERAISGLALQVKTVQEKRNRINELKKRMEPLARRQKGDLLLVIKELSQIIPKDSWITQFEMSEDLIQIRGNSENANALIPILEKSPMLREVTFTSPLVKRKNKDVFHIQMRSEK